MTTRNLFLLSVNVSLFALCYPFSLALLSPAADLAAQIRGTRAEKRCDAITSCFHYFHYALIRRHQRDGSERAFFLANGLQSRLMRFLRATLAKAVCRSLMRACQLIRVKKRVSSRLALTDAEMALRRSKVFRWDMYES